MSAMPSSSPRVSTTPVGLFGLANMMARVRGVTARSIAARSGRKPLSAPRRHRHDVGAGDADRRLVGDVHRVEHQHLVARLEEAERGREQRVLRAGQHDDVLRADRRAAARRDGRGRSPRAAPAGRGCRCSACRRARSAPTAASVIGAGVAKSGSPIDRTITSPPARLAATAALWISQAAAPSPLIRSTRWRISHDVSVSLLLPRHRFERYAYHIEQMFKSLLMATLRICAAIARGE